MTAQLETGSDSIVSVHTNNNIFSYLIKYDPVKLEISLTGIFAPIKVSVLWSRVRVLLPVDGEIKSFFAKFISEISTCEPISETP